MDFVIRPARIEDAPGVSRILRALGWWVHINNEAADATSARLARHLEMCLTGQSHSVYVAEAVDGDLCAYAAVHWLPYLMLPGPEGYVSELIVDEPWRGRGLGARLLEAVQAEARERGCSRLGLLNMRNRESYKRRFYEKLGWTERTHAANFVLPL